MSVITNFKHLFFGTFYRVPASEKADKDLFFVEKNVNDDDTTLASGKLTRHDIRHKPLQSEIFLQPNPAIKGFCAQKRRNASAKVLSNALPHSLDSSSDENEYETSASYSAMKQELGTRLVSHRKQQPEKSTVHMAARDLWAEGRLYFIGVWFNKLVYRAQERSGT